jgi:hypothetical protein
MSQTHVPDCPPTKQGCALEKTWTAWGYEYDCGYGTTIDCEQCKYGACGGRKDPEAKCNQPKQ